MNTSLVFALACACLLTLPACDSESTESVAPSPDADTSEDAAAPDDAAADTSPIEDAAPEAAVEAGPASCEDPCSTACASNQSIQGECASCVDSVCAGYRERADKAPKRDGFVACINACGTTAGCPDSCCSKFPQPCAWEVGFQMCACGFPEESCTADCSDTCSKAGLTEPCGVCASQSSCSLATFDYLFAPSRMTHQDCIETCTSSSLTLQECLDRCRKDYPEAGAAYDGFLACACK